MPLIRLGKSFLPSGEWLPGEKYERCPACENGDLIYYWQEEFYQLKCDACKYLHDTGRKLTDAEKETTKRIIAEVHESEKFQ